MLCIFLLTLVLDHVVASPFGPVYPITAAIFKDRFSVAEWNTTLDQFERQGGDTVVLRAPALVVRTKSSIDSDPDYSSCTDTHSGRPSSCYDEATKDLLNQGLNVLAVITYSYEEDYGPSILKCPDYDRILASTANKKYHRLVLPTTNISPDCKFSKGTDVVVLLTVFSGIDPHQQLLQSATSRSISVIFGLPSQPVLSISTVDLMPAYISWIERVLKDHQTRYSMSSLYQTISGYLSREEILLPDVTLKLVQFYEKISNYIHASKKKLLVMANINLVKLTSNKTVSDHVEGFSKISNMFSSGVDIVCVHEGRGYGNAGFYWQTQINTPINDTDAQLMKILQRLHPMINPKITFGEVFTGSTQQLFLALQNYRNTKNSTSDLWLFLEAEENLQDEPCLPVDTKGSGNAEIMDRTTKSRIDHSLTASSATVQKVMSFAYDPEFTCTTKSYSVPLTEEISRDSGRPIVSNCTFHSSANRSVVVLGYNLEGLTQGFQVDWPDRDGKRHTDHVYGYYFEIDYGEQNGLIPSLEYVQLYDPYDVISLADHGYVKVQAEDSYHGCEFIFDFR